ncbi:MAG: carbon starvation protein A [Bacteroidales bacterium]|nr:carbon starvation protein A [Bacteroidales bacterium]
MNTLVLTILAIAGYILAYRLYGRFIGARLFRLSSSNPMPSHTLRDGIDYEPAKKNIIFGHHFTTIAGLGPIVGPAIGIIWGWLPAFIWIFIGSIFMGAVHDFTTLVVSARNEGKTIGELTGRYVSPQARIVFQMIMQLLLFIVLAVFAAIVSTLFLMYPESVIPVWFQIPIAIWLGYEIRRGKNDLVYSIIAVALMYASILLGVYLPVSLPFEADTSVVVWCVILFVYVFFASTLPVYRLLQPRDYINSHQLLLAMGLMVTGLIIAHPPLSAPAINQLAFKEGSDVPALAPVMFIIIACGAISGFHALASSGTTVKQVDKENDTLFIAYGGMLTESFLAVLVLMAIAGGLGIGMESEGVVLTGSDAFYKHYSSWASADGLGAKLGAFITGTANLYQSFGIPPALGAPMIAVFIVSFANTTLDSAARIQRLSLQEIFRDKDGKTRKPINNRYFSTFIIVLVAAIMTFLKPGGQGAMVLWPLFGSLNQLMAALALGVVTIYLHLKKKNILFTLLPMLFVLFITLWAMLENLFRYYKDKDIVLVVLSVVIILFTLLLIFSGVKALLGKISS